MADSGPSSSAHNAGDGDDEIAEVDPEGSYCRYKEPVGKGRFKTVFKAFNSQIGIDVAWSKVSAESNHLSQEQLHSVAKDMMTGLELDHPNIIKCFRCWEDEEHGCINLITELFTSGNLRQYRNMHKHLDLKAVKRMAKQILRGLQYLHGMTPSVTHGDLRCDKIYVNGHSGEIKIGDLGLATLLPYRWEDHEGHKAAFDTSVDVFAFGLCMLELITLKQLDPQHCSNWPDLLADVVDEEARTFIAKCLGPPEQRPTAEQLLADPFFAVRKEKQLTDNPEHSASAKSLPGLPMDGERGGGERRPTGDVEAEVGAGEAAIAVGRLKGEDYEFVFSAKTAEGKLHFQLTMLGVTKPGEENQLKRDIEFVFDPETDTADSLAGELSQQFNLSPTDTEICAAALKEYLAKELGSELND
ncbi:hypothetical protein CHLRE_06g302800v5 [Chlamydomonas reinhardtii]|uniref:non-specific serine/threonine protein kinase n=1 Tax=Chlamydomonas reinhardtii TaxID=3055 RepID=A8INH4_CHLRE|nr:uncharacterized protein CHLRE_06g302800v5 [Chlamydomonas reinhardtii]PNW83006.1 hypothetical protein CHLRE_06g302800v5 [Chlamydomonas reinhardtii]|eukprot:XP_001691414.1 MAP kinase-like protein [Chlamydomonas reinhardtii]